MAFSFMPLGSAVASFDNSDVIVLKNEPRTVFEKREIGEGGKFF